MHDTILRNQLGEKTSQEAFQKVFKPITTKLDDMALRNVIMRKRMKRPAVPDYGIAIEDEVPDYGLDYLFDEGIQPDNKKQLVPKPPIYEDSLKDISEGKKEIYVDPQYIPEDPKDMPPEYDEDQDIDYALDDEDSGNKILDDMEIPNYDDIEAQLYLEKI